MGGKSKALLVLAALGVSLGVGIHSGGASSVSPGRNDEAAALSSLAALPRIADLADGAPLLRTKAGRRDLQAVVACALPAGHEVTRRDHEGRAHTFTGKQGLAREWETGRCGPDCVAWLSTCVVARMTASGRPAGT